MPTSIFEDTNPRKLEDLLRLIHKGEAALPDFQRDFVWDPNATQELIISIMMNFPAGSLLRIRNSDMFAWRTFQGAPEINNSKDLTFLILDGQQRLTSLYQAFYDQGDHVYYLDLRALIEGRDFEDALFHLRRNSADAKRLGTKDKQFEELKLPLGIIYGSSGGFSEWSRNARRHSFWIDKRDWLEEQLEGVETLWLKTVEHYAFPVVTLSSNTSAEAVCTIFETLNRTGVKLSVFELLTARFWPSGINLRELWATSQEEFPILEEFEIDPFYLLQSIALLSSSPMSCKRGDVLKLEPEAIQEYWRPVCKSMADGIELLYSECGVLTRKWLPISPLLVTFGALLGSNESSLSPNHASNRFKLIRWYWCSVLSGKYESGPNSQAAKDVSELNVWLKGGEEPETVNSFRFDRSALKETSFRQRALYRALMGLVLRNRPRDFYTGEVLSGDLIRGGGVDDHHIFPQAYLPDSIPSRLRDSVLNRTLIDSRTNRTIKQNSPSAYLGRVEAALGESRFESLLGSHLLPSNENSSLRTDDWERFLGEREEVLWKEILKVTEGTDS